MDSWQTNKENSEIKLNGHGRPPEGIEKRIDGMVANIPRPMSLYFLTVSKKKANMMEQVALSYFFLIAPFIKRP